MNRRNLTCLLGFACASVLLTGCMPTMTVADMKAMMPPRPVELDELNAFVGSWTGEAEMKMTGVEELIKSTATNETKWAGNKSYIVGNNVFHMEGFDEMHGMEVWTYDSHSKRFRSSWVDSMGSMGSGEGWHNKKNDTWYMRATSHGPFGKTCMKGHVKFIDADNMEWSMTEYALGGLMKTMEMSGTSRRK